MSNPYTVPQPCGANKYSVQPNLICNTVINKQKTTLPLILNLVKIRGGPVFMLNKEHCVKAPIFLLFLHIKLG